MRDNFQEVNIVLVFSLSNHFLPTSAPCPAEQLFAEADAHTSPPARFQVENILSEPSEAWGGRKGRVDAGLLRDVLNAPEGSRCFVCVCGPTAFTELTVRCVKASPGSFISLRRSVEAL